MAGLRAPYGHDGDDGENDGNGGGGGCGGNGGGGGGCNNSDNAGLIARAQAHRRRVAQRVAPVDFPPKQPQQHWPVMGVGLQGG